MDEKRIKDWWEREVKYEALAHKISECAAGYLLLAGIAAVLGVTELEDGSLWPISNKSWDTLQEVSKILEEQTHFLCKMGSLSAERDYKIAEQHMRK